MNYKINTLKRGGGILLASIMMLGSIFLFSQNARGSNTDIIINEIGAYESSAHEWIEIFNKGNDPIDLTGWKFWEDATNHGLTLIQGDDFIVNPGEYAVITQNDANFKTDYPGITITIFDSSWSSLNESGEEIGLKDASGNFVEQFIYLPATDYSLERKDASLPDYTATNWIEHPNGNSAGQVNYWTGSGEPLENMPPTAVIDASPTSTVGVEITLNGSASTDADGAINNYEWSIDSVSIGAGSIINHTFSATGTFVVSLLVTDDDGATDGASLSITAEEESSNPPPTSTAPTIVINEFASDAPTGEDEWIELYNISTSTADLTGFTLHDGASQIFAPTSTIPANGFAVIALSSSKLNNDGDIVMLKNSAGEIVDSVVYGNWDDGNTADNAPETGDPNSAARIVDGQDTDNDKNDFAETTTPTRGTSNQITAPITTPPSSGGSSGSGSSQPTAPTVNYNASDVVINELVADPTDDAEEFVELYNNTNNPITLDNWYLEDGGETKTALAGSVSAKGFLVIEKPKGSLNNSGDIIILFDPTGKQIDKMTYGSWDDGNIADNAPAPADPMSLIRKIDGQDGNNDYYDFVLTGTITKGRANVITSVTAEGEKIEQTVGSTDIIINEVLPNPTGADDEEEWVELKNIGAETINLMGWKLGDASAKRYEIKQGAISPSGFIIFKRSMTGIALNNTGGDEVGLYSANNTKLDSIKYTGSAAEGESYARRDDNSWSWTIKTTPGAANIVEGKSAAPIIAIDTDTEVAVNDAVVFDASDTEDPEGDKISFAWNFDDGQTDDGALVEHNFNKEGVYAVKLIATDANENKSEKSVIITVKNALDFIGSSSNTAVENIKISEIVPNPAGSDTTEFIELFNPADEAIDLSGLKLDDEEGGSRAYAIPDGTVIDAKEYKIFGKQETKLALNNTSDSVRILYPDGTILTEVRYDDVPEANAYIQDAEENWIWTGSLTPGEANILSVAKVVAGVKITKSKSKSKYVKPIINTTLEKIRDEDVGDMVTVAGVVAVKPGVLGTQYFYIVGSPGVQVYMFKKDFPELTIGDRVEVTGELTETGGNTRIKLAQKSDIKLIDHPGDPKVENAEVAEVGEPFEGRLVQVNGEVTEVKSSYMYVDDGTEEIKVYFKRGAGINSKLLQPGDIVTVTGIVEQTKDSYQILPRGQEDILKTGVAEEAVIKIASAETASQREVAEKYLTATAGGLTAILIGLFLQARGATILAWIKKMIGK